MLAVVSIEDNTFIIDVFGSENELADTLSVSYKGKVQCSISIADLSDDFCIAVKDKQKHTYYRLVNDAFTASDINPKSEIPIAEYSNRKLIIYTNPNNIYSLINRFVFDRIRHIPYESVPISDTDKSDILSLIQAGANIYEYDYETTDIDTLMRKVLYTYPSFQPITDFTPNASESNSSLKLCSEKYISSAVYNVFRKTAPHPAVNMLTEIGYCYNDGYYYYTGGYTDYFHTEVHDILKTFKTDNNGLYIVFNNTYTENNSSVEEYSSALVRKDDDGYFIAKLKMGDDFKNITSIADTDGVSANHDDFEKTLKSLLPFIIMLFTLAAVGVVIYIYIIRL